MSGEGNLGVLPSDIILLIFSRLSSKSIAICRCVSKLWSSVLESPNFTELFLTQSRTRPRLLFMILRNDGDWCLYSCPQPPQISDKNPESSLSVTAEFHMSLLTDTFDNMSPPISGLFYSSSSQILYNPSTRQILRLRFFLYADHIFFGYDPIDKRFSLLAINQSRPTLSYQILKIGSGELSWRNIECPEHHCLYGSNICVNGILYYLACTVSNPPSYKIACFDLNSEEFKLMNRPWYGEAKLLVNFNGKLGGILTKWVISVEKGCFLELSFWVLEDVERQEWSKRVYYMPPMSKLWKQGGYQYRVLGVTGKSDIVLALGFMTNPFYVYFFNLEDNTLQKVKIEGLEGLRETYFKGCVDYIEELRVLKWS